VVDAEELYELPPEEERTAWYEPGLLRRVGRRRRADRPQRRSLRQRMRDRGLHWSAELVVGVLVAVLVVSLATIAVVDLRAGTGGGLAIPGNAPDSAAGGAGAVAAPRSQPTPTPPCIAAPIPGSAMRPCAH
jgi:hypothetical protein